MGHNPIHAKYMSYNPSVGTLEICRALREKPNSLLLHQVLESTIDLLSPLFSAEQGSDGKWCHHGLMWDREPSWEEGYSPDPVLIPIWMGKGANRNIRIGNIEIL